MLDTRWRRMPRAGRSRRPPQTTPIQPPQAALRLPGLQGARHGAAEYPRRELFRAGRQVCNCRRPIGLRYPLIELPPACCRVWWPGNSASATGVAALALTWFLIALTFIDIDTQLLPDSMTCPLLWIGLLGQRVAPSGRACPWTRRSARLIGAIAGYLSLWLVFHALPAADRERRDGLR